MNRPFDKIWFSVNGRAASVAAVPGRRLSHVLREDLGLRGTKVGCDAGDCGACTVLLNGEPVCACLTPAAQAARAEVTTVEGLDDEPGRDLQRAFLRHGAAQCGICTPGMLMAAAALLRNTPRPSRTEAQDALGGVLCRCTGYAKIIDAVCDVGSVAAPATRVAAGAAVGARLERLDGLPKVQGTEIYGADRAMHEMLEVRAIRSPHHAANFEIGDWAAWAAWSLISWPRRGSVT